MVQVIKRNDSDWMAAFGWRSHTPDTLQNIKNLTPPVFFTFRAAISQGSQRVNIYDYTRNVYYQVKQQNIVV